MDSGHEKGQAFEHEVAQLYRRMGATVQHNVVLAGNQVDVLVKERTPSGTLITAAVECKSHTRPVGVSFVNFFAALAHLYRQRGLINSAVLVSQSSFTVQARQAAQEHGVELLEIADLRAAAEARGSVAEVLETVPPESEADRHSSLPKQVFVCMPFDETFNDAYIIGIRETAEKLGLSAIRADDIEYTGQVMPQIKAQIARADLVVADITGANPNVMYEIGYSHALGKRTVLICRRDEHPPFDLLGHLYLPYASIDDLRNALERRLAALLGCSDEIDA